MATLTTKKGAVGAAPYVHSTTGFGKKGTLCVYTLPPQYRNLIWFAADDKTIAFKGARALLLDFLIDAKPAGIGIRDSWPWCQNLADTIRALRSRGIVIVHRPAKPKGAYHLVSEVRRIGGAQ